MNIFLSTLLSYPVIVFFIPFCVFSVLMIIDFLFNISDGHLSNDIGDMDSSLAAKLFLPSVLTLVPLPIMLCLSTFAATILMYYAETLLFQNISGNFTGVLIAISLIGIYYLALHISAIVLRPLAPILNQANAFAAIDFNGKRAFVRSVTVNEEQGEVVIVEGGNEIQIDAYNSLNEDINYGDEVLIISKNEDTQRYLVSRLEP
ncbi:DUF1449 domain-containing protein [Photobacterium nomapromontoriensis]|uniref:DUF1449 domain-containing protein n=1 Tax=Photobacterium nomapromontoriensis TaxID=2910237 RepID=UPI003D100745